MIASKICWCVTLLVVCLAGFDLVGVVLNTSASAIQQAAGAALVVAACIVPYVFTRCIEGLERPAVATVEVRQPVLELTTPAPRSGVRAVAGPRFGA
jgi:hypothetical protein